MADISFPSFTFPVTGGTSNFSLPDHLKNNYLNIIDLGADPTGVNASDDAFERAVYYSEDYIELEAAQSYPGTPTNAVRATMTATVGSGQVTALTIGTTGDNYEPGRVYALTFSGGAGTGAAGTATADGSGVINQASLAITSAGSGYTSAPTVKVEYPGHTITLTFTTIQDVYTLAFNKWTVVVGKKDVITPLSVPTSVNVPNKTVTLVGYLESNYPTIGENSAVVRPPGIVAGDKVRFFNSVVRKIFIPAGNFRVTRSIEVNGAARGGHIFGVGKASRIYGDIAGDAILRRGFFQDQATGGNASASSGPRMFEKFSIENTNATGIGFRAGGCVGVLIRDLHIKANLCLTTYNQENLMNNAAWGSLDTAIENCIFQSGGDSRRTNSIGLAVMSEGPVKNCIFYDLATGIITATGQGGQNYLGCKFEKCDTGFRAGIMPSGESLSGGVTFMRGCYFTNCGTAIYGPIANSIYSGLYIEDGAANISGGVQYGIRVNGNALRGLLAGIYITGSYGVAGINDFGSDANLSCRTFMGVKSPSWTFIVTPQKASSGRYIDCNNPARVYAFADLPSGTSSAANGPNARTGDMYNINNCNTNTWGATAAAGAPNNHVLVRRNAANNWTVVGK